VSPDKPERLRALADDIEAEMRSLGIWLDDPPSEETVLSGGAFGMGTVAFDNWVQVVFVTRLRQAADGVFPIPSSSSVGTQALREWDGAGPPDRDRLLGLILDVDDLIEGRAGD
jgi:uncharacterized protein YqcC (DUF446 family)